jgi:single-strand DNA-binding protein
MLKVFAIGNLTRDPELRATQSGVQVCSFTLAVNRKKATEADYIRVNAWRGLADSCHRYLSKGKKAAVTGTLTLSSYTLNDGQQRYQMEVQADEVEFLSPKPSGDMPGDPPSGFVSIDDPDLPF